MNITVEITKTNRVLVAVVASIFNGAETTEVVVDPTDIPREQVDECLLLLSKSPYNVLTLG